MIIFELILSNVVCTQAAEAASACPNGEEEVNCFADPCSLASECKGNPSATCKSNYCGGCNGVFYDNEGNVVDCEAHG